MLIKRSIAIITAACFLFSFVFAPSAQALGIGSEDSLRTALADNAFIPPAAGKVSSAKSFGSDIVVINIQDLHCHPEVQRNISRILSSLDGKFSLDEVYVEGGYGDVDTSRLCLSDESLKKRLVESLVEQGKLTGAEYYSVTANCPHLLKGIEDRQLHRENLARLGRLMERKGRYERQLQALSRDLAFMQAKYMGVENRKFNQLIAGYRDGAVDTDRYYAALEHYVKRINAQPERFDAPRPIRLEDYPNIALYRELSRLGRTINYRQVSSETRAFMGMLKERLPYRTYNELLEATDGFSRLDELYVYLAAIARDPSLETGRRFPNLAHFFDYTEKSQQLNPRLMIEEERRLVEEVRLGLSRDIAELEVSFLDDFFGNFRNYLLTRLAADDYDYFVQNFDRFRKLWATYAMRDRLPELAGDLPLLEEYYRVNCERNTCFLRNMPDIAAAVPGRAAGLTGKAAVADIVGTPDRRPKPIVVVTGGFHTPGIEKLLEERKISYVTVMPAVTIGTTFSDAAYATFACQQASILSSQLALGLAAQFSDQAMFDLLLQTAAQDLKDTRFTEENVAELIARIGEATGVEGTRLVFDAARGEAIIVLTDGSSVVVTRDAAGGIALSAGERKPVSLRDASRAALAAADGVLSASAGLVNVVAMVPAGYPALKNLLTFAVRRGLVPGDGLIYRIASDPELREAVDGIPIELVAAFPEGAQEMVLEHVRREGALDAAAKRSAVLRALLAVDLVRDVLLAASPAPVPGVEDDLVRLASSSDRARNELDADVLIICGNDDLRTLEEAVALYGEGKTRAIMATGGVGRLTLPLLRTVFNRGIRTVELVPGAAEKVLTLDQETLAQWETAMNGTAEESLALMNALRARGVSEALVTKALLLDMARERGVNLPPQAILAETESTNTPENFTKARALLRQLRRDLGRAVRAAYIQKPLQQLRTKATFNAAFANGIDSPGDIEGISYTFDVDRENAALDSRTGKALDPVQPATAEFWRLILYSAVGDVTLDAERGLSALSEKNWSKVLAAMQAFPDKEALRGALLQLAEAPGVKTRLGGREALEKALKEKGQLTAGVASVIAWVYGEKGISGGQEGASRAAPAEGSIEALLAYPLDGEVSRFVTWLDKILLQTDRVLGEEELYAEAEKIGISRFRAEDLAGRAKTIGAFSAAFVDTLPRDNAYDVFLLRDSFGLYAAARLAGRNARAMYFSKALFGGLLRSKVSQGVLPYLFRDIRKEIGAGMHDNLSPAQFAEFKRLLREALKEELTADGPERSVPGMKERFRAAVPLILAYLDRLEMPDYGTRGARFIDTTKTGTLVLFLESLLELPLRELGLSDREFEGLFGSRMVYSDLSDTLGYPGMTLETARLLESGMYPVKFDERTSRIDPLTGEPSMTEVPGDKASFLFLTVALRNELLRRAGAAGREGKASGDEEIARLGAIAARDPGTITPADKTFIMDLSKRHAFVPEAVAGYSNEELQKHAGALRILLVAGRRAARGPQEVPPVVLSAFDEIGTQYFAHEFSHLTLDLLYAGGFVPVPREQIEDNYAWRRLMIWEGLHGLDLRTKLALMDLLIEYCLENRRVREDARVRLEKEKDAVGPYLSIIENLMTGSAVDCSLVLHTLQTFKTAEAGDLLELKAVDIAGSLRSTLEPYGANKKTLSISFDLADNLPAVAANPIKLAYVWVNLYTNSRDAVIKARRMPGRIAVAADEVRKDGRRFVRITFTDTAGGIPAELLKDDRLFEKGVTGTPGHTGLGLYLVRETVREFGGTVSVESREGDGTTFTILLPVYREPEAAPGARAENFLSQALSRFLDWQPLKGLSKASSPAAPAAAPAYSGLSYGVSPASNAAPKIEFFEGGRVFEQLGSQVPLSFRQDLAGAEVLVIGPGRRSTEVRELIARYPGIAAIHVVDVNEEVLAEVRSGLADKGPAGPQIHFYRADARDLPGELAGRIDLAFAGAVFDRSYFTPSQQKDAARSIERALKSNGVFLSATFHLAPQAFDGTGLREVSLESDMFKAAVKVAPLAERMRALVLHMDSSAGDRRAAYDELFRVIETEVLGMEEKDRLDLLNDVAEYARNRRGSDAFYNFWNFLRDISRARRLDGNGRIVSIILNPDTLYRRVVRGMALEELRYVIETGEDVKIAEYGTFARPGEDAEGYTGKTASEGFVDNREVVIAVKAPRWLMVPADNDFGLGYFGDDTEEIFRRHKPVIERHLEEARAIAAEGKAAYEERLGRYEAELRRSRGERAMNAQEKARFFQSRENKVYENARREVEILSSRLERWSEKTAVLAALDAGYIDWNATYDLNKERFSGEPERWALDVEPLLAAARKSPPGRVRAASGTNAGEGPAALTLRSSYAAARAIFRSFGWKPARGLSDDALEAFAARQDRVAEYTLVPFVLVWDIVAHTFQLLIGRGGLNKYRGGGAAAIWTATAIAALAAGFAFHAGAGWIVLSAYLANAVTHALYNLFFGSTTKAGSALTSDSFNPRRPPLGGGVSPTGSGNAYLVEILPELGIFEQLASQASLSFGPDLAGAEVLLIGPGYSSGEVEKFIELYPKLKTIHVVDIHEDVLLRVRAGLEHKGLSGPQIRYHKADARSLPAELTGAMDLVYASSVFDTAYFFGPGQQEAAESIVRVLKRNGVFLSAVHHLDYGAFFGMGMRHVPLDSYSYRASVKTAGPVGEAVIRELGAAGLVPVAMSAGSDEAKKAEVIRALQDGNVVALTIPDGSLTYHDINLLLTGLARSLAERFGPEMGGLDVEFSVKEILKNAFVHGNLLDRALPIYLRVDARTQSIGVCNVVREGRPSSEELQKANDAYLFNQGAAVGIMKRGRKGGTYEDRRVDVPGLPGTKLYVARTVSLSSLKPGSPLTLASSYAAARAIFRSFGWKPAAGLSDEALAAFEDRQDRVAEYTLVPFVLVRDIVAHTFQLLIGKGGLNKYRGGGAAVIWTATAAAALTAGFAFHAGIFGILASAYLANAITHALYNLFFGSTTRANSALSFAPFDPRMPPGGKGVAPTGSGNSFIVETLSELEVLDALASRTALSFSPDLAGAEVLLIGPGYSGSEVEKFLELYPGIKTIHVVDIYEDVLLSVQAELAKRGLVGPQVRFHKADARFLPGELAGKIDLVYANAVFDTQYFTSRQQREAARSITQVLKQNGAFISGTHHLDNGAFYDTGMRTVPLGAYGYHAEVKSAAPAAEAEKRRTAGLIGEAVDRECGAPGIVPVRITGHPSDGFTPDTPQFEPVFNALKDGKVVALSLSEGRRSYQYVRSLFANLGLYLRDRLDPELKTMNISFLVREMLMNAFVHGHQLDQALPIYLQVDINKKVVRVCNVIAPGDAVVPLEEWQAAYDAGLYGEQSGVHMMRMMSDYADYSVSVPGTAETRIFVAEAKAKPGYRGFRSRALTVRSSYAFARAIFRFFGWKPAAGLSGEALAAFEARQDRVAEYTLVPFVLVWDIVAHTFQLLIGRGGLNKYRGGGAAVIWTATAAAALITGFAFHAGAGWTVLSAYLANAVTHTLYNLFFGSTTQAGSPLSTDAIDPAHPPYSRGLAPLTMPFTKYLDNFEWFYDMMASEKTLSFRKDLAGADVLLVGPGRGTDEIERFLELYPDIGTLHVVDIHAANLEEIRAELAGKGTDTRKLRFYHADVRDLPAELAGRIDLAYASHIFDSEYFTEEQAREGVQSVGRALRENGALVTVAFHPHAEAFAGTGLELFPRFYREFMGAVKAPAPSAGKAVSPKARARAAAARMKSAALRMDSSVSDRKDAYEELFRLIETEVLGLDRKEQLRLLNEVWAYVGSHSDGDAPHNFWQFLRAISDTVQFNMGGRIVSITLSPDSLYHTVIRGMPLAELKDILETGEDVKVAEYATFANPGEESEGYTRATADGGFVDNREVLISVKAPRWLMVRANNDFGLGCFGENSKEILQRHKPVMDKLLAEAQATVDANREAYEERLSRYKEELQRTRGRGRMTAEEEARFYRARENKVYKDAERDVATLASRVKRWSGRDAVLATIDARYIDWETTYELNRKRFAGEPERWALDVEPLLAAARRSPPSRLRDISAAGETAGKGPASALTIPSSYAAARAIFRSFGWKPARGLSDDALEAFAARQDRVAEYTLVPFVLVWDIVAHTFQLFIGRGGLNKYRGGGAAAIWTATAVAALAAGFAFHAGAGWIVLSAYLANAVTHALYNLFFGSDTEADSPLSTGSIDPAHPPFSRGMAPLVSPLERYVDSIDGYYDLIAPRRTLSFRKDLAGAEVLVIGPGRGSAEIERFLKLYPGIKTLHIVDINDAALELVRAGLEQKGLDGPRIRYHKADVRDLPAALAGSIDLVYASRIFDGDYFTPEQVQEGVRGIDRVLKADGALITVMYHPGRRAFEGTGLETFPTVYGDQKTTFQAAIKKPAPSGRTDKTAGEVTTLDAAQDAALTEQGTPPRAVLPGNRGAVARWAMEGRSPLSIAVRVTLREFPASVLMPRSFVRGHTDEAGRRGARSVVSWTWLGAGIGLALGAAAAFLGASLALPVAGVAAGLIAGNAASHIFIDWHYVKASGLAGAVKDFGAAAIDGNGRVRTNIYLLDSMPDNPAEWELRNTGLNVDGKPVWASTKLGALVLFAETKDAERVLRELGAAVAGKGPVAGNARLVARLKDFFDSLRIKTGDAGFAPSLTIDHTAPDRAIGYTADGTMTVGAAFFRNDAGAFDRSTISARLGELATIRNAEAVATAQNIGFRLDDVTTYGQFKKRLGDFNRVGNGQMVVKAAVFDGIPDREVAAWITLGRMNGVRIYVEAYDGSALGRFDRLGFAGFAASEGRRVTLVSFATHNGIPGETIEGYRNASELRGMIRHSDAPFKLFNLSEVAGLLDGADRSIVDRVDILEVFRTNVLGLFDAGALDAGYATRVALAWDREKLPVIAEHKVERLVQVTADEQGTAGDIIAEFGAAGLPREVAAYLAKLASDAGGDREKARVLQKAFLRTLVERMLARARLDREGKHDGLADEDLERLLGQKLFLQAQFGHGIRYLLIDPEVITGRAHRENWTAERTYTELAWTVKGLRDDIRPMAINSVIELIARLGEPRVARHQQKAPLLFNERSMQAVLQAA